MKINKIKSSTVIAFVVGLMTVIASFIVMPFGKASVMFRSNQSNESGSYFTPTPTPNYEISEEPQINPEGILFSADDDCDGVENDMDNCLFTFNPNQKDRNKNGIGDRCEPDPMDKKVFFLACDGDGDGIIEIKDNCPIVCNPDQKDANNNGIGDICDPEFANPILGEKVCLKRLKIKKPKLPK